MYFVYNIFLSVLLCCDDNACIFIKFNYVLFNQARWKALKMCMEKNKFIFYWKITSTLTYFYFFLFIWYDIYVKEI